MINKILNYLQGNLRYQVFYTPFNWLIRSHVREQIEFRVFVMELSCYLQGSCVRCGCRTTALQMCDAPCEKPCYPPIMKKEYWKSFKGGNGVLVKGDEWKAKEEKGKIKIYKNKELVNTKEISGTRWRIK